MVELAFININSNTCHPFHLHGYNFRVVAEGKLEKEYTVEYFKTLIENGMIVCIFIIWSVLFPMEYMNVKKFHFNRNFLETIIY